MTDHQRMDLHRSVSSPVHHGFDQTQLCEIAQKSLQFAKRSGADSAEVEITEEKGFSVSARAGEVETLEHHQSKSLVVTIFKNQRTGSASTSDLSDAAITAAVEKAYTIATYTSRDEYAGLAKPELMAYDYPDLELYFPWDLTPDRAITLAIECETIAREQDKRILDSEGASIDTYQSFDVYANTHGFMGVCPSTMHSISCSVVAQENNEKQRDYDYTRSRNPAHLADITFVARHAAAKTLQRLGAQKLTTRRCPVIFYAPVAKGLLSTFIAAISGSNLYRGTSFLIDSLGKTVFPSHVQIYQRPHMIGGIGSAAFDGEGVLTYEQHYCQEGMVSNYVLGSYSARKLKMETTGNAGGVFNLFVSHSDYSLEKLLEQMGRGLLVTELMGQGVNLITGDYSRGAVGYWVENGKIQYPVEEITIASNLKDLFANLVLVGNDVDSRGNIHTGSILLEEMTIAGQ